MGPQLDMLRDAAAVMPRARRSDPQTSKDAAASAGDLASTHRSQVLGALAVHGAMGKTRIAAVTGIGDVAVARRLSELGEAGLATPTGQTERSASGRAERVWKAVRRDGATTTCRTEPSEQRA